MKHILYIDLVIVRMYQYIELMVLIVYRCKMYKDKQQRKWIESLEAILLDMLRKYIYLLHVRHDKELSHQTGEILQRNYNSILVWRHTISFPNVALFISIYSVINEIKFLTLHHNIG